MSNLKSCNINLKAHEPKKQYNSKFTKNKRRSADIIAMDPKDIKRSKLAQFKRDSAAYRRMQQDVLDSEKEYKLFCEKYMIYNEFLANKVLRLIATDPRPLRDLIRENPDLPSVGTIYSWRIDSDDFRERFMDAKAAQAQIVIDEILELSDDPANCETDILNWSKTRIETRKWLATKLIKHVYGNKVQSEVTVNHENQLKELE